MLELKTDYEIDRYVYQQSEYFKAIIMDQGTMHSKEIERSLLSLVKLSLYKNDPDNSTTRFNAAYDLLISYTLKRLIKISSDYDLREDSGIVTFYDDSI